MPPTTLARIIVYHLIKIMFLFVCGINHKTAPLAVRERVALNNASLQLALQDLTHQVGIKEAVIVSTCNRMEIYAVAHEQGDLLRWLQQRFHLSHVEITQYFYIYREQAVVKHLLRVAGGLDSMVLGEPQILGQVKLAYTLAVDVNTIADRLGHLFPYVFSAAKKIRYSTQIGQGSMSVAYIAVQLAEKIVADLTTAKVLLIGAGKTIESVARYFVDHHVKHLTIANRTLEHARELAEKSDSASITISDIPQHLAAMDVVVTSTASSLPILGKGLVESAMKTRDNQPLFIVDLAVPRDVESQVGELAHVHLYNIDDLQQLANDNLRYRQSVVKQAEMIIEEEVQYFQQWQSSLKSTPAICEYRHHVEQLRDQAVAKALLALKNGNAAEDVIITLGKKLTQKLMHAPSVQMRKASHEGRKDLLAWSKKLLGLEQTELCTVKNN
ncbi:MAG: glutamyl-tRNA reductase [Gammaproteobacteria bacterium]|nr:glutamyl-tRNA reductase [Gammaproteobacteria bacterium]